MTNVESIGLALGTSFAAGLNAYATVALLGAAEHFGLVSLPTGLGILGHPAVILVAGVLFLIEFFADKIPWIDSAWDTLHTFIRPLGGALIALTALGDASPAAETMVALLGGTVAASTHFTKAGTRVVANASPEPFSNWAASFGEDIALGVLMWLVVAHPVAAVVIAGVVVVAAALLATWIVRMLRKLFTRSASTPA